MLKELSIKNFALIDELVIEWNAGLNVMTGETGAGKSIVLDAIGLLCGRRASASFIRKGADFARVEGYFQLEDEILKKINDLDLISCEKELFLSREISATGNNKCKINYKTVPQGVYQSIGTLLFDIHGQNQEQSLLDPGKQLELLDGFLSKEGQEALTQTETLFKTWKSLKNKIEALEQADQEQLERLDYYRFAIDEIESAGLQLEEEDQLRNAKQRIANGEKLSKKGTEIYSLLYGNGAVLNALDSSVYLLKEMSHMDDTLESIAEVMERIYYELESVSGDFKDYYETLEFDEQALNTIENRLAEINRLKRKYGPSVELILEKQTEMLQGIEQVENKESILQDLRRKVIDIQKNYEDCAGKLSAERRKSAEAIRQLIKENLEHLGIYGESFIVHFEPSEPTGKGTEKIEFYFSPNKGEGAQPLKKIASGGEISRVMLAFKQVFINLDFVPSLVFDEIDTGVGGDALLKVAKRLYDISTKRQVICVTHGPMIAAFADSHYHIKKETIEDRTVVSVIHLDSIESRSEEIARMLGGRKNLNLAEEQGKEMILFAINEKKV